MRTNEERTRLIHRRTAELKREQQKKNQRGLDAVCMAACLLLVVSISALMPELMTGVADGGVSHASGAACLVGESCRAGLYPDGSACLPSWCVRNGALVPSAPQK